MIDISKGRYWDLPWSLVSGCTPCSPGCDHCWALAIEKRFKKYQDQDGEWLGNKVLTHPERLSIPLKRRKPTVYAVWNDLYHKNVSESFRVNAYATMVPSKRHTFLILTKRASIMADFLSPHTCFKEPAFENIYHGLTICNQPELDAKMGDFLQVPGKKFLSLEPLLGPIGISRYFRPLHTDPVDCPNVRMHDEDWCGCRLVDAVILGGETGPGARPLHPDWVRSVRDQCAAAGVPFFFKGWGKHIPDLKDCFGKEVVSPYSALASDIHRLLDGRTHDYLPWVTK